MKSTQSKVVATVLRRLAKEIESMSDAELSALVESKNPLLVRLEEGLGGGPEKKHIQPAFNIQSLLNRLAALPNREAGEALLQAEVESRAELVQIAKVIDVPVNKRHTVRQIIDIIIEATIGFRIRSAAIRGNSVVPSDSDKTSSS